MIFKKLNVFIEREREKTINFLICLTQVNVIGAAYKICFDNRMTIKLPRVYCHDAPPPPL